MNLKSSPVLCMEKQNLSVDELRHFLLKSKCEGDITLKSLSSSTLDLARLPPSYACLREHIAKANYQTHIWKCASVAISEVPKPWEGHGWLENGEPKWCQNEMILPQPLVDILSAASADDSEDEDMSDQELEYGTESEDSDSDSE